MKRWKCLNIHCVRMELEAQQDECLAYYPTMHFPFFSYPLSIFSLCFISISFLSLPLRLSFSCSVELYFMFITADCHYHVGCWLLPMFLSLSAFSTFLVILGTFDFPILTCTMFLLCVQLRLWLQYSFFFTKKSNVLVLLIFVFLFSFSLSFFVFLFDNK